MVSIIFLNSGLPHLRFQHSQKLPVIMCIKHHSFQESYQINM